MMKPSIKQALIVVSGCESGSKLVKNRPLPLRKLLGMPVLERIIRLAREAGMESVVVAVGDDADQVVPFLTSRDFGLPVSWVKRAATQSETFLNAKTVLGEAPVVVLQADTVIDSAAIRAFAAEGVAVGEINVAVSPEQATAPGAASRRVDGATEIGMTAYASLSDVDSLRRKTWAIPSSSYWQTLSDAASFRTAEKKLLNSCRKPTDGWVSRNINRYISLWLTRWLMKTSLSANSVTGLISIVGALSGVVVASGTYWSFFIGTFLFNLASVLDGCDGEVARLRFSSSKLGQWLDTASDNSTYIIYFIGLMIGIYRQEHSPYFPYWVGATIFGVTMLFIVMFNYLTRYTDSGSLVSIKKDLEAKDHLVPKGIVGFLVGKCNFAIRRDFFAFFFVFLALLGEADWILYLVMIGTNIAWMALLNVRRNLVGAQSRVAREEV